MFADLTAASRPEAPRRTPSEGWRLRILRSTLEIHAELEVIVAALGVAGYTPDEAFGVRLALEEALVNAVKHGNRGDPAKRVRLRFRVMAGRFVAEVEDEGGGFDPQQVPDPFAPENRERDGGRGLLLIRHYMSWVRYNAAGNRVILCKRRG